MSHSDTVMEFLQEISESHQLKFVVGFLTLGALTVPLAILMAFGLPEKLAYILLLIGFFPVQYFSLYYGRAFLRQISTDSTDSGPGALIRGTENSVADDWRAELSTDKTELFRSVVRGWESRYAVTSAALDRALSLRALGELAGAREQSAIASNLLGQLAKSLVSSCGVIYHYGRSLPKGPRVVPLQFEFFRGTTGRSAAARSQLIHRLLLTERGRFLSKLQILSKVIEKIDVEFNFAADCVRKVSSENSEKYWKMLDSLHYDFNTCICEIEILLKSFVRLLPSERLAAFDQSIRETQPSRKGLIMERDFFSTRGPFDTHRHWQEVTCEVIVRMVKVHSTGGN